MKKKAPSKNPRQKWYDDNRERFGVETESVEIALPHRCSHYFERESSTRVQCRDCNAGWIDMGKWQVENGKVTQ